MKKNSSLSNIIQTILEIWIPLSKRRKRQFCLLGILMLFGGLSEAISLGLVVPFLVALTSPEKLLSHPYFGIATSWLETAGTFLGIKSEIIEHMLNRYILLLAGIFVFAALLAGGIRLLLLWFGLRLSNAAGLDLGQEVFNRTLHQPFHVHIGQNSSTIVSLLTHKIPMFSLSLSSFLTLVTSGIIALFLVVALMIVSPATTLGAALCLGICYFLISSINSKRLAINSQVASHMQDAVVKSIQEGLGGIRDIILDGTQKVFCDVYKKKEMKLRQASASTMFLSYSPRFYMESLGIIIFSVLAFTLSREQGSLSSSLPTLGALVLGVQRLLPALQQGYQAWSTLLAYQQSNKEVISLLDQPISSRAHLPAPKPMLFKKEIQFKDVKFRYSSQAPWVLNGLSFTIPKGARVGFVGKTGSGKSTCLDLLMGLLAPQEGLILIDGQLLASQNMRSWQINIAHVPQAIYLADSTLAENIAFGIPPEKIDLERVRMVAQQAEISEFIEASPDSYSAKVGERGIRLSGGQRQRIGIARALYKKAQVLVFDEATSALDHETENAVIKAINSLKSGTTVIHIAHRVTTLKYCDRIINLDTNKRRYPE